MTPPIIFIDECIGGKLVAAALRDLGVDVRIQSELPHIPRQTDDREWAAAVAKEGWVAVTRDKRIRTRLAEKQAVADAGLALFVLTAKRNLSRDLIVETIANAAAKMPKFMADHPPPFIAAVHSSGKIELREQL